MNFMNTEKGYKVKKIEVEIKKREFLEGLITNPIILEKLSSEVAKLDYGLIPEAKYVVVTLHPQGKTHKDR